MHNYRPKRFQPSSTDLRIESRIREMERRYNQSTNSALKKAAKMELARLVGLRSDEMKKHLGLSD